MSPSAVFKVYRPHGKLLLVSSPSESSTMNSVEPSMRTTDIFTFEAGGAYEISSGTRGDFYSDDAGGFTGQ